MPKTIMRYWVISLVKVREYLYQGHILSLCSLIYPSNLSKMKIYYQTEATFRLVYLQNISQLIFEPLNLLMRIRLFAQRLSILRNRVFQNIGDVRYRPCRTLSETSVQALSD